MREIPPSSNISLVSFGDEDSFAPHTCRHWQIGHPHARRCFVRGGTCDHCLRSKVRVIPSVLIPVNKPCTEHYDRCPAIRLLDQARHHVQNASSPRQNAPSAEH